MTLSFRSSARLHRLLIAAGLLVPALFFAGAAWKSRTDVMHEEETTILNAVEVLGDSLRDQLQIEELVLAEVVNHLRGLDWSDIEKPETRDFLARLTASLDEVNAIWIADHDGTIRAASQAREPGSRIAERAFFQTDQHGDLYVSAILTGESMQPVSLSVIRRRVAPDGRFDGTIHAELKPAYLAHLFARGTPSVHDVLMVQTDGEVLGGYGSQRGLWHLGAGDSLMRHIVAQPRSGLFAGPSVLGDHNEELYSYEQVPGYPVWVSLGVDRATILQR